MRGTEERETEVMEAKVKGREVRRVMRREGIDNEGKECRGVRGNGKGWEMCGVW